MGTRGLEGRHKVVNLGTCEERAFKLKFLRGLEGELLPIAGTHGARIVGEFITAFIGMITQDIGALLGSLLGLVLVEQGIDLSAVERFVLVLHLTPPLDALALAQLALVVAALVPQLALRRQAHA